MTQELMDYVNKVAKTLSKNKNYGFHAAEEIAQETFLALVKKGITELTKANQTYIWGIIKHKHLDYFNQQIKPFQEITPIHYHNQQYELDDFDEENEPINLSIEAQKTLYHLIKKWYLEGQIKPKNLNKYKVYSYRILGYDYDYIAQKTGLKYSSCLVHYCNVQKEIEQYFKNNN